jgi:hypothetical protein
MNLACARRGGERGAAIVEFAIVLPVFLMLVLGAIDWGWFFVVQDAVSNAAREGARAEVVGLDGVDKAKTLLSGMLPDSEATRCDATKTPIVGPPAAVRIDATCPVGSLSGLSKIPPFDWIMPATATAGVVMRL